MSTKLSTRCLGSVAVSVGAALAMSIMAIHAFPPAIEVNTGQRASVVQPGLASETLEMLDPQARQAGADESWWQTVSAGIERQEYAPSETEQGLQAPNRAQNLRTTFGDRGIEIGPRTHEGVTPARRFAWETTGFGRPGRMEEVSSSSPSSAGARVVYEHDGFSEWYENTPKGLEQGFTVERRPAGSGPLQIAGTFPKALRPQPAKDGAVEFLDAHGARVIRYGELHVWDALGQELPAELVLAGNTLAIQIEDQGATYPLTVDPLMDSPAWIVDSGSNGLGAWFGYSVATAGDVNGDGFSDVIVGAPFLATGGRAFVYHGSAAGLDTLPAWTAESNQAYAWFGYSVATAGDVNRDGFSDVVVGAFFFDNGQLDEGRAYVYHGSASGLATSAAWTGEGNEVQAGYGVSVATAGDVNGDGYGDVIVGESTTTSYEWPEEEGRAFVYHGSAAGLAPSAAWIGRGNQAGAFYGSSVATAGDVNGDGFADIVVGVPYYNNGHFDEGRTYVYHGSAAGLPNFPAWVGEGDQAFAMFGSSVGTAGDVNGDGFSDVIVGAHGFDNGHLREGRAFVYHGSAAGLAPSAAWIGEENQAQAHYGVSVATAGDVNGDGFSDVIVGADRYDGGRHDGGRACVYHGSAGGLATAPAWTGEGSQNGAFYGVSVATAGDVNGDGFSDAIVGAYAIIDKVTIDQGQALVYHGSAAGLATSHGWTAESNQANAQLGISVGTAGDVNGDGYSDVIVGAYLFDNGLTDEGRAFVYHGSAMGLATSPAWVGEGDQINAWFGFSVGTAGDVNGDGYSDVIIGASRFANGPEPNHGEPLERETVPNEGRAFVYHGSAAGLATAAAWTAESNQNSARFGISAATAGDVNGDGFSDVIVGANRFDNGQPDEGRAFVYHGSPAGLATSAAWTAESDQHIAEFGFSVATAGDVNGDGFSDVIVGASFFDNGQFDEGRAYVYHGSASGLATSAAWTGEGNQAHAGYGFSVATAGDVNGDGYGDVIVSALTSDEWQAGEELAFVYHGSAAGLAASAAWIGESNQAEAGYGFSVATAGDVNGDGFSDVIVGAGRYDNGNTHEGRAFVYHGSVAGLGPGAAWTAEGDQSLAEFGSAVAPAGDVNGDGFSDVIVGAPGYGKGGSAFIYYGNDGDGLDRLPRQARTDDSGPIWLLGESDSESTLRLKAMGRTAAGRGNVRLELEVKPASVPFDGTGLVTGAVTNTGAPSGAGSIVPLSQLASGLTPATLYHWRLRTVSDSPFFPRSPWLGLPYNAITEADVRTQGEATAVGEGPASPTARGFLEPNIPNPFAAQTQLAYTLGNSGWYRLAVYDVTGRQVALLAEGIERPGRHTMTWNGNDEQGHRLAAGIYFLKLELGDRTEARKVVLAR